MTKTPLQYTASFRQNSAGDGALPVDLVPTFAPRGAWADDSGTQKTVTSSALSASFTIASSFLALVHFPLTSAWVVRTVCSCIRISSSRTIQLMTQEEFCRTCPFRQLIITHLQSGAGMSLFCTHFMDLLTPWSNSTNLWRCKRAMFNLSIYALFEASDLPSDVDFDLAHRHQSPHRRRGPNTFFLYLLLLLYLFLP